MANGWPISRSRGESETNSSPRGRAKPHHVLPDSGWVSRVIRSAEEVGDVVALFRLNYERLVGISKVPARDD